MSHVLRNGRGLGYMSKRAEFVFKSLISPREVMKAIIKNENNTDKPFLIKEGCEVELSSEKRKKLPDEKG